MLNLQSPLLRTFAMPWLILPQSATCKLDALNIIKIQAKSIIVCDELQQLKPIICRTSLKCNCYQTLPAIYFIFDKCLLFVRQIKSFDLESIK